MLFETDWPSRILPRTAARRLRARAESLCSMSTLKHSSMVRPARTRVANWRVTSDSSRRESLGRAKRSQAAPGADGTDAFDGKRREASLAQERPGVPLGVRFDHPAGLAAAGIERAVFETRHRKRVLLSPHSRLIHGKRAALPRGWSRQSAPSASRLRASCACRPYARTRRARPPRYGRVSGAARPRR